MTTLSIDSKLLNQTEHRAVLTADQVDQALARTVLEALGPRRWACLTRGA